MSNEQVAMINAIPTFAWIIVLLLAGSPIVYFAGRLLNVGRWVALIAIAVAWLPFVLAVNELQAGVITYSIGTVALHFDGLSALLAAVALGIGTVVVIY